ncbi:MAG TPA: Rid family detoxifying hydrolase [Spirochaetia bacterium]|nr:Rid family detoxifying hydrolase [Spirochaetia bacterium]HRZ89013.1 Rid family detoxifying hydrolase [Spirochaetia bacterium]
MMRTKIETPDAPAAIGPYSQAIRYGDLLFVSGQLPIDPAKGAMEAPDIAVQTRRVLSNLTAVVRAAGMKPENILRCTCFLADMNEFPKFNEVYAEFFGKDAPSRETVQVARLPKDSRVEISAVCGA